MRREIEELVREHARPVGLFLHFFEKFPGLYAFPESSSFTSRFFIEER